MNWEVVIGLEIHAQLSTKSKMFSRASTVFGAAPNTQASAVDIALPGVLPVANREAVAKAICFGLAVNGGDAKNISRRSVFARKNYFYPDLPKGYQISQFDLPIVQGGEVPIVSPTRGEVKIRLTRAHLEEDAGKSFHGEAISAVAGYGVAGLTTVGTPLINESRDLTKLSAIDLNRAGVPLLEIVSEPEIRTAQEAVLYAKTLHALVRRYEICDGNMEEGSFRCDANVSVRRLGAPLGTRCEIKNLNSFRFLERAIEFETRRQIEILEEGGKIVLETRLYDSDKDETRSMRSKEEAHDYRYFPDPDLPPLMITEDDIERVRANMPRSLESVRQLFVEKGIPAHVAAFLTVNPTGRTKLIEQANTVLSQYRLSPDKHAEILTSTTNAVVSSSNAKLDDWGTALFMHPALPNDLIQIQRHVAEGIISGRQAKEVQEAVLDGQGTADEIIQRGDIKQISDSGAIEKIVDEVLAKNAKQVEDYRAGKDKAFNSLVGQVMKATQGKANPAQVNEILKRKLVR